MTSVSRKGLAIVFVSLCLVSFAPLASATHNDCKPTGGTNHGQADSPPCLTVPVGAETYYVYLIPDRDGDVANGVDFWVTFVWKESNGCPGLQRTHSGSATTFCPADTRVLW